MSFLVKPLENIPLQGARHWGHRVLLALLLAGGLGPAFAASKAPAPMRPLVISPALKSVPLVSAETAVGRELVRSDWYRTAQAIELRVRQGKVSQPFLAAYQQDRIQPLSALSQEQVLPDDHAWPSGCSSFGLVLEQTLDRVRTPQGMSRWLDWRMVHSVVCLSDKEQAADDAHWAARVVAPLAVMQEWALAPFVRAVPLEAWVTQAIRPLPLSDLACMRAEWPQALRRGLDRHEGLRYMAKACGLSPEAVFGSTVKCDGCGGHPRSVSRSLRRALVSR